MQTRDDSCTTAGLSRWLGPAAVGIVVVAAVLLNQSVVHLRENTADSHLFAFYGWSIAHGARPYLDTWDNKPPGIWWANALAFRALGDSSAVDAFVGGSALGLTLAAAAAIIATLRSGAFLAVGLPLSAALLTHLSFESGANRTETLVVCAETLGVFAYIRWLASRRFRWLIAAGAFLGAAPWCKQSGLGALAACGLHLLFVCRPLSGRAVLSLLVGLLIPTIVFAAVLARDGALAKAWYAAVQFNRLYFEIGDAGWHGFRVTADALGPHLAPLPWYFLLAAVALAASGGRIVRTLSRRGETRASASMRGAVNVEGAGTSAHPRRRFPGVNALFAVWLTVNLALVAIGVGRLAYHLMVVLPPLALLATEGLAIAIGTVRRDEGTGTFIEQLVRSPRSTAVATLGLAIAAGSLADSAREGARFAAALRNAPWTALIAHPWSDDGLAVPEGFAEQAAEIRRLARPTDAIYVWGWSPGSYRYAYRRSACRFATIEKVGQLRGRGRFLLDEVTATLRQEPPVVFLISPGDLEGLLKLPRDDFADWFARSYSPVSLINGMWILKRSSGAMTAPAAAR